MSDEELDKLFKEAADGFQIKDDSEAWKTMSARLDQKVPSSSYLNWKNIAIYSGVLVIIGFLTYQFAEVDDQLVDSKPKNSNQILSQQPTTQALESKAEESGVIVQPGKLSTPSESPKANVNSRKENLKSLKNHYQSSQSTVTVERSHTMNSTTPATLSQNELNYRNDIRTESSNSDNVFENNKQTGFESAVVVTPISNEPSRVGSNDADDSKLQAKERSFANAAYDSLAMDSIVATENKLVLMDSSKANDIIPQKKSYINSRGISIKLSLSPDFSSIEMFTPDRSGINYGVQFGYNFNNRWSVFTGAIYSRKIYSSTEIDESYTNSGGYDYPVLKLDGDCRVIDIPVNAYYAFFNKQAISLRAGLGLSSYIMLSEDYTYYVDNPYGSDVYTQHVSKENNEWFKMLNLSVGFQTRLKERLFIELEPFIKTPLAGVGEGEVDLVSMGAFINLRYDIF